MSAFACLPNTAMPSSAAAKRRWWYGLLGLTFLFSGEAYADQATLVWLNGDQVETRTLGVATTQPLQGHGVASTAQSPMPLGSLWKLFVYAYAVDQGLNMPDYHCQQRTSTPNERAFCCLPGGSINRDTALVRSCSPFFDPQRLHISPTQWQTYWRRHADADSQWLTQLDHMAPNYRVSPTQVLHGLRSIPIPAREAARRTLINLSLNGFARASLPTLGTFARMKTYTWSDAGTQGMYIGGAAGWLPLGTPFWFTGAGSSEQVLTRWSRPLAEILQSIELPSTQSASSDEPCVDVRFFNRYPLRAVNTLQGQTLSAGSLHQPTRLLFENGQTLTIQPHDDITLEYSPQGQPSLHGRYALNAYVARVIAREGDTRQEAAAQALGVLARTYVLQNGESRGGCYQLPDDSRYQRVSANSPSREALRAAWFTDGLILNGSPVHYHTERSGPGLFSVAQATRQAQQGRHYVDLLQQAFPQAYFSGLQSMDDCERLSSAEAWLHSMQARWQPQLLREPGFEAPDPLPVVCRALFGNPYSDQRRMRIYVHEGLDYQARLAITHEYLHLGFRFHPQGMNETYIEQWARKLSELPAGNRQSPSTM